MSNPSQIILKMIDAILELAHNLEEEVLTRHSVDYDQLKGMDVHPVTLRLLQRDLSPVVSARALIEPAFEFVQKPFDCSACEDWPEPPNNPCAVCGKIRGAA